ncbi:MAG: leucine-rich repeat protein [Lentisphaerae bacterium]|nr:leucine-rich repeat protein [Lentisphaerota bacterium]
MVIRYPVLSITVTKEYDGDNSIVAEQCQLNGVAPGDTVTLTTLTGSYITGKHIQLDGSLTLYHGPILGGPDGDNYSVAPPTVGSIMPKQLSINVTKEYDGNDSILLEQCQLNGVVPEDTVIMATLDGAYADGHHVQHDGPINLSVWPTLDGPDSHNYTVAAPATGDITPANLTVLVTKIFDGDNFIKPDQCSLVGVIGGDSVTLAILAGTYDLGSGAQTAGPLTVTDGPALDGTAAGNYSVTPPPTGDISVFLYIVQDEATITITSYVGNEARVNVPDTLADKPVTRIAEHAFAGHAGLITVELPAGITNIAGNAFTEAHGLEFINVSASNQFYSSINGVLFDKAVTLFIQYPRARTGSYAMPDTVLEIAEKSFYGCSGLTSVEIPEGVTNIGRFAFYQCAGLRSLLIPGSVRHIGASAFQGCYGLQNIDFGAGNLNIDEWAFAGCHSLAGAQFFGEVGYIGYRVFNECGALKGVYFSGDAPGHGLGLFKGADRVFVYYRQGTLGWGAFYAERPTVLWPDIVETPVFSPDGGDYLVNSVTVTVTCATVDSTIHYTINGDVPTRESPVVASGGAAVVPVPGTLKAQAYHAVIPRSSLKTAIFHASEAVATPEFNPDGGAHKGDFMEVTVDCATAGATIHFTTDGSIPTRISPAVADGGSVQVSVPGTLQARAWRTDLRPSALKSAVFTRRPPAPDPDPPDPDPDYPKPPVGPSLRANDRRGELFVSYPSLVSVTVTTQYEQDAGLPADWWAVAIPDYGGVWYYLNNEFEWVSFPAGDHNLFMCQPVYQGPLMTISDPVVLLPPTILPRGVYYIHFAMDKLDGVLNQYLVWDNDMVRVVVE